MANQSAQEREALARRRAEMHSASVKRQQEIEEERDLHQKIVSIIKNDARERLNDERARHDARLRELRSTW